MKISELFEVYDTPPLDNKLSTVSTKHEEVYTAMDVDGDKIDVLFAFYLGGGIMEIMFLVNGRSDLTDVSWKKMVTIMSTVRNILVMRLPTIVERHPDISDIRFTSLVSEPSRGKHYRNRVVPFFSELLGNKWSYSGEDLNDEEITFSWQHIDQ